LRESHAHQGAMELYAALHHIGMRAFAVSAFVTP